MRGIRTVDDIFVLRGILQLYIHAPILQQEIQTTEGTAPQCLPHEIQKLHKKMVEYKTPIEGWQVPSIAHPEPINNKKEEGGMEFSEQGKTTALKNNPKGKCHRYGLVNENFLSGYKVVSKEVKKMIMSDKRQEWQAKEQGVVAKEVGKEEVESENTEDPPEPSHEELKERFGLKKLRIHHSKVDDVVDFGFYQLGTHTDKVSMINPTKSGVDDKDEVTTSVVSDNSMKTGMKFVEFIMETLSV